ncbi:phage holin family protein [Occultella glacieicola]|uniref:Phage holin family protein n=1 Tax=Occultella glacieicola TaxID=2518684 RepID=A0ABY2EAG8_9MICO|nr:phage holin family protein [Occultella glacieicola]TDE98946.1 phage holin family protein [Occultella glacieicola]
MSFVIRVIINGIAIWLTSLWLSGLELATDGTPLGTLIVVAVVALVFTLVNAVVKPIVQVLSIPFYILTLGLFHLVVNALMLMLTTWLTSFTNYGLTVDGFWSAVLAALVISIIAVILSVILPSGKKKQTR